MFSEGRERVHLERMDLKLLQNMSRCFHSCENYEHFLHIIFLGNLNTCPEFAPPKHGHMICDHLLGKYCTPSCNAGYEPERIPAWAYVCNPATKRWATYPESYPLPWPDCVPKG